jgi:1,4-alpha-glucan branching enzyme
LRSKSFCYLISIFRWIKKFEGNEGSFLNFAKSYNKFGLNVDSDGVITYREWAPSAKEVSLVIINFF